jgi:hypothetical protein
MHIYDVHCWSFILKGFINHISFPCNHNILVATGHIILTINSFLHTACHWYKKFVSSSLFDYVAKHHEYPFCIFPKNKF